MLLRLVASSAVSSSPVRATARSGHGKSRCAIRTVDGRRLLSDFRLFGACMLSARKDPPACAALSSFESPSCGFAALCNIQRQRSPASPQQPLGTILNLPCQSAHIIQASAALPKAVPYFFLLSPAAGAAALLE